MKPLCHGETREVSQRSLPLFFKIALVPLLSHGLIVVSILVQDWKIEKRSSDIFVPSSNDGSGGTVATSDTYADEEASLIPMARLSYLGRTQFSNHAA